MRILNPGRLIGAAAIVAALPAFWAVSATAQAPAPTPSQDQPSVQPTPTPPVTTGKTAESPLVGLEVFSADGQNLGKVTHAIAASDGKVSAIRIKVGGLLGIGGKTVAIPAGKFALSGKNIRLGMTSDEVNKLPAVDAKQG
jgi:hypothetical protein